MKAKALEIRDRNTFIPMLAVDINPDNPEQRYLMRRLGYPCDGRPNVIMTRLDGSGMATNDPHAWDGRTYPVAHDWIIDHWTELKDGDVVDVEFILGETSHAKISERISASFGEGSSADPGCGQANQDTGESLPAFTGWRPISEAPQRVVGRDALVGEYVNEWGWRKVGIWDTSTRDQCIARGVTHWWPHLRELPAP